MKCIWYAETPTWNTYRTASGSPVWPIVCPEDLQALEALGAIWGFELQPCRAEALEVVDENTEGRRETVLAYGSGTRETAKVYAHLTGRRLECARDHEALAGVRNLTVVVALEEGVTPELLDAMVPAASVSRLPGLIFAPTAESLRQRSLCCAVTAVAPCRSREIIQYVPRAPGGLHTSGLRKNAGTKTSARETEELLSSGSGLLMVTTHSNGVDAMLTDEKILCNVKGRAELKLEGAPNCVVTSQCRLLNQPLEEALASDTLISPTIIRTGMLLWLSCYGILSSKGPLDVNWGLIRRIWLTSSVGAVITSLANLVSFDATVSCLTNDIADGLDISSSLARYLTRSRYLGNRLCLLGDPSAALLFKSDSAAGARKPSSNSGPSPYSAWLGKTTLLRLFLDGLEKNRVRADVQQALGLLASFEKAAWKPAELVKGTVPELNAAVAAAIAYLMPATWLNHWMRYADAQRGELKANSTCRVCDEQATTIRYPAPIPGATPREYTRCWHCLAVDDVPEGFDGVFVARDGLAKLGNVDHFADGEWRAMLRILAGGAQPRLIPWPAKHTSTPSGELRTEEPWPPGDISVGLIFVHDAEVAIMTRFVRGS